jgi:DNA-binding SARP family transcriptional activator
LAQALRHARAQDAGGVFRWLVVGFRRMLALALSEEIEADCARGLIAEFRIRPESSDFERWPWTVRVHTLGGFALSVDGVPVRAAGKTQKKPLELLKALLSQGARDVNSAALAAMLWPHSEGDAAADALEVTLRRLRKLLGHEEAIRLQDGRVTLNESVCWVDISAFEYTHRRAEVVLADGAAGVSDGALEALERQLMARYPGHFLAGENESPWMLACRQRLASRFFRHLAAIGQLWEAKDAPEKAELTYRRGVELDSLSEVLYRRLMSVQSRRGERAEALATYRRCRSMLATTFGVEPSAETEAAYRAALARG